MTLNCSGQGRKNWELGIGKAGDGVSQIRQSRVSELCPEGVKCRGAALNQLNFSALAVGDAKHMQRRLLWRCAFVKKGRLL